MLPAQCRTPGHLAPGTDAQGHVVFGSKQGLRDVWSLVQQLALCFLRCKIRTWELKEDVHCFPPQLVEGQESPCCPKRVLSTSLLLGFFFLNWRGSHFLGFILYLAINNVLGRVCVWGISGLWLQVKEGSVL